MTMRNLVGVGKVLMVLAIAGAQDVSMASADISGRTENAYQEARVALVRRTAETLKRQARSPDTIVFERMRTNRVGTVACAMYTARNLMGRTSTWAIVAVNDRISNDNPELVKKHCRTDMVDMLYAAR
jgi:hypothetical protein